jgi:phosphoserine aminotransferase
MNQPVHRIFNFSAGPAALPLPVLQQAQAEMLDYKGSGMSIMEMSHRSKTFDGVMAEVDRDYRALLGIPENYKVLFLQGGATMQFSMVPMNFLPKEGSADYVLNGSWSKNAIKEAKKVGKVRVAASAEATNFNCVPDFGPDTFDSQAAYLHFTSNETIHGVEFFKEPPAPAGVPLICDMSSDFISRPVDVSKYALIYAGAQKNAGPAGVVVAIIRDDMLEKVPANLPVMLDYKVMAESGSMHNTPPTYAIYIVGLVAKWALEQGGLAAIEKNNRAKANLIYNAIDNSGGFYKGHATKESRSLMNITFRLPNEELEAAFAKSATAAGLDGLKGHRSVGGLRASIYNAHPMEGVKALVDFMVEFQKKNG